MNHPDRQASRPAEPDHPMALHANRTPGNVRLMLRCMLEEMLMAGLSLQQLRAMTADPEYQGLYQARQALGDAQTRTLLDDLARRSAQVRCRVWESTTRTQPADLTVSAAPRPSTDPEGN